jgi:hypothetical protein
MESHTKGMKIRMAKEKELEWEYLQMVIKIMVNGILIKDMGAERWNGQMVKVIGGISRMIRRKDMHHGRGLMDTYTTVNTWMMSSTGMEHTVGLMEQYITETTNMIRKMDMDLTGGHMAMNIGESSRMACNGEKESHIRWENCTKKNMKKTSSSAEVKYTESLESLSWS